MGLDMYLSCRTYMGWNYEHRRAGKEIPDLSKFGVDCNKVTYIEESVIYWRKANAIHAWFVDNVQEGNDDCKDYSVSTQQLKELLTLVEDVLDRKDEKYAAAMLPPQEGFFFGSKDIDPYYWDDLQRTKEELAKALASGKENFTYTSSW